MQYSHSKVDCHNSCPYKYKSRYVDKLKKIPAYEADNALICGNTIHMGAEKDLNSALDFYYSNYPIITDRHVEEVMKFEHQIPKIHQMLDGVDVYKKEFRINTSRFVGIVDLITKNEDGTFDVFDYKYSNAIEKYLESPQLHIYKYFLEQIGFKVRKLGFIFIPKVSIKQKQEETIYQFRKRLMVELNNSKIQIAEIQYDTTKVIDFMDDIIKINEDKDFKKSPTQLCDWCDYKKLCLEENDVDMQLPKNERREKQIDENPDLWIYAQSYVGKSTLIDQYEDLLFINTDGNTDNTTAPVIPIADKVWYEGRLQKKQFAWEIFKEAITELEKKDNSFKRVALDLVEDLYEHCRLFMYDKHGWEHESDGGYGKGWDMIKTEFLSTIKRLKSLGYQVIYISKEVATEVTLKNGTKYTTYAPNIGVKVANVLAGTVDLTVRAYVNGDKRYIQLAKDENSFGGGRFNFAEKNCELNMEAFTAALIGAQKTVGHVINKMKEDEKPSCRKSRAAADKPHDTEKTPVEETEPQDKVKQDEEVKQTRRSLKPADTEIVDAEVVEKTPTDAAPIEGDKPRRRRSRKAE